MSTPVRARAGWLTSLALLTAAAAVAGAQPPAPERSPVTLVVTLPADAVLTIDGAPTRQTGAERRYVSPPLTPGKTYVYTLAAAWTDGGTPRKAERRVEVQAGKDVKVDLTGEAVSAAGDKLQPPAGHVELFRVRAEGWQVYEAKAKPGDSARPEWVLKEPRADLFDDRGNKVGKHFRDAKLGGPAFEAPDGSKVVVALPPVASTPQPDAIPWLLLQAKAAEGGGKLGRVTYVQRVNTWAGRAPAEAPDAAAGEKAMKYEATYVFYGKRPD
jgi:uncharacterized protein (TIGR03000 family)